MQGENLSPVLRAADRFIVALDGHEALFDRFAANLDACIANPPVGAVDRRAMRVFGERLRAALWPLETRSLTEGLALELLRNYPRIAAGSVNAQGVYVFSKMFATAADTLNRSLHRTPRNNAGKEEVAKLKAEIQTEATQ